VCNALYAKVASLKCTRHCSQWRFWSNAVEESDWDGTGKLCLCIDFVLLFLYFPVLLFICSLY